MDSSLAAVDRKPLASIPVPNPFTRRLARSLLGRATHLVAPAELEQSALVFSPHPDDESLGCGGTILKKKQAGANVKIVHVSDGGASSALIPREELTAMRRMECMDAGRALGVDEHLTSWTFPTEIYVNTFRRYGSSGGDIAPRIARAGFFAVFP